MPTIIRCNEFESKVCFVDAFGNPFPAMTNTTIIEPTDRKAARMRGQSGAEAYILAQSLGDEIKSFDNGTNCFTVTNATPRSDISIRSCVEDCNTKRNYIARPRGTTVGTGADDMLNKLTAGTWTAADINKYQLLNGQLIQRAINGDSNTFTVDRPAEFKALFPCVKQVFQSRYDVLFITNNSTNARPSIGWGSAANPFPPSSHFATPLPGGGTWAELETLLNKYGYAWANKSLWVDGANNVVFKQTDGLELDAATKTFRVDAATMDTLNPAWPIHYAQRVCNWMPVAPSHSGIVISSVKHQFAVDGGAGATQPELYKWVKDYDEIQSGRPAIYNANPGWDLLTNTGGTVFPSWDGSAIGGHSSQRNQTYYGQWEGAWRSIEAVKSLCPDVYVAYEFLGLHIPFSQTRWRASYRNQFPTQTDAQADAYFRQRVDDMWRITDAMIVPDLATANSLGMGWLGQATLDRLRGTTCNETWAGIVFDYPAKDQTNPIP